MNLPNDTLLWDRQQELLREAENERLARQARAEQKHATTLYGPALAQVGTWLVIAGERLQAHSNQEQPAQRENR